MSSYSLKLFSHKKILNNLINLDKINKLPTRILISGQEGIGKTTFAFHLINYLFSKNETHKYDISKNEINFINKSYNFVTELTHPNFFLISRVAEKKNIEVEQIRNMISFLNKSSLDNNKKIILIDGAEYLNTSSSNAMLKSIEETNNHNIIILTYNINKVLLDTIKSRCLTFSLSHNYSENDKIINHHFESDIYNQLNIDFKSIVLSPKFIIEHINFAKDNKLDLNSLNVISLIKFIINNKIYKKDNFIANNFQTYIEIYFTKMYSKTKDYRYYDNLLNTITETNLIDKLNLDLDSFFIKFENKYLNIQS